MIKKLAYTLLLTIALIVSLSATASANTSGYTKVNDQGHTVDVRKIQHVSYSEREGVFYVYTEEDSTGSAWVMDFQPKKGETLSQFKKRVVGSYLIVKYNENVDIDEEVEIVGKYIWKAVY